MVDIASISIDDGLAIDTANVTAETIRDESADYAGVRVSFAATLATAKVNFHVDINVGDPIEPEPTITSVPRILGGSIEVLGYPVEMVVAEKLVTAFQRGTANTRWRDFVDMHRITGSHPMSGKQLIKSTMAVVDYRDATLAPLDDVSEGTAARSSGTPICDAGCWTARHGPAPVGLTGNRQRATVGDNRAAALSCCRCPCAGAGSQRATRGLGVIV